MHNLKYKFTVYVLILLMNFLLALFLISTNKLTTNEEARGISAGVSHWCAGEFEPANDSPPLARMVGLLPLLPLGFNYEVGTWKLGTTGPDDGSDVRDRELTYAGRFAKLNGSFNFAYLPRMMNFLWWLVGAWVISHWSTRLYGGMAGVLGMVLWSIVPIVLEHEQLATPELPAAVACAAAIYSYRSYLLTPSWQRALVFGLFLGVAQLVEFVSLNLLVIWTLMVLVHCLFRGIRISPLPKGHSQLLRVAAALALSIWIINVGYGFVGSGSPLGSIPFVSDVLKGDARPIDHDPEGRPLGNRFRETWIGRVLVPLPAEYVRGLVRRWDERETARGRRIEEVEPRKFPHRPQTMPWSGLPNGIWLMMLVSLTLLVSRHPCSAPFAEELTLWLPAVAFLAMPSQVIGPLSLTTGTLLATPFAIIIASKLARFVQSGRRDVRWLVIGLIVFTVGDMTVNLRKNHITIDRTTRIRQDLVRQGRKLGLAVPEPRTSIGTGSGERGLLYRTFVDSRGIEMDYALFVPDSYHGDRPYPLILFLHGWGDRGTTDRTNRMYTEVGLPFTLKYRSIDFLVLCPQGRSGFWVADGDDSRRAMELLATVQREYRVDPKRISLTGLSSGGEGVYGLAAHYPDRWAALVPVAGADDPNKATSIKHIPCWCFHNRYDGFTPVEGPRRMIEALRTLGGSPRYTEYLDTNHNAGERAYVLPELYDWLERQWLP
jgi:pimeloyl-ACP methyl ester carboxylesterase